MKNFTMTEEEFKQGCDDYQGICLACGEFRDSCEPDAQHYKCPACGEKKVMGFEMALVCGHIEFEGE